MSTGERNNRASKHAGWSVKFAASWLTCLTSVEADTELWCGWYIGIRARVITEW